MSLKPNAASHYNTSWYTDTDGFLEHLPSGESLYYKGPTLQKIIRGGGLGPLSDIKHFAQCLAHSELSISVSYYSRELWAWVLEGPRMGQATTCLTR